MIMVETQDITKGDIELIAGIDIGSNMIRMEIGQLYPDGRIDVIERLQRAVHLGQDTFVRGRLGRKTIRAAILILRDYKNILEQYKVTHYRAVATSSVREAANAEIFIDRVLISTGIEVQVIDTAEESRLTVSAVQKETGTDSDLFAEWTLITEVGGGSTVLTVMNNREIVASQSLGLGSVRLKEVFTDRYESVEQSTELLQNEISSVLSTVEKLIPFRKITHFLAVGADARFSARQVGHSAKAAPLHTVPRVKMDHLVEHCRSLSPEQIVGEYDLPFADAETLGLALMIFHNLIHLTRVKQILVSNVSMRDGLLLDLARRIRGQEDEMLVQAARRSALVVAEKYRIDLDHARSMADISLKLFDNLAAEHRLGSRHRLMLEIAALLHECGTFISGRAYHKHSYYVILNTEIFGLSQKDIALVAHIARYHRRGRPKTTHDDYINLSRDRRIVVNKLASLLRMATALEIKRGRFIDAFSCEIREDRFVLTLPPEVDAMIIQTRMQNKSDLFRDVYGLDVAFR